MTKHRRWSPKLAAAGTSAAVIVLTLTPAGVSKASVPLQVQFGGPTFAGTALAHGIDFTVTNRTFPLGLVPQFAGPTTSSSLNSLGQSDSFASFPYPGDTVANLPSVAGALLPIPVPAYPLYVATQSGDQPKDNNFPGIALHAESGDFTSYAKAVFGQDASGGVSSSRVEQFSDGSVRSTADTKFKALELGPVLSLSGVTSTAQVYADGTTGKLTRTQSMSFSHLAAPGLALKLPTTTPATAPLPNPVPGLPQLPPVTFPEIPIPLVGGMTIPAPDIGYVDGTFTITLPGLGNQKFAVPASTVTEALKGLGITMTIQQPETSSTGVVAAGVTFAYSIPSPPQNDYFSGPTTIAYTVGRTSANVTLKAVLNTSERGDSGGPTGSTGSSSSSGSTSVGSSPTGTSGVPSLTGGGISPSSSGSEPDASPSLANDTGAGAGSASSRATSLASSFTRLAGPNTAGIYLVLVGVAFVSLLAATVLRFMGVRSL